MMKKILVLAGLLLLSGSGFGSNEEAAKQVSQDNCRRPAAEADIENTVYEAGSASSVVVALLSGNTQKAAEDLGSELAIKVVLLNAQLESNSCNASKEALSRIYPMLRVIAAVNHKTPIPKLNENKQVLSILEKAVADNPKHYQRLLERSANWDSGIK
jgi:hypothetical protein